MAGGSNVRARVRALALLVAGGALLPSEHGHPELAALEGRDRHDESAGGEFLSLLHTHYEWRCVVVLFRSVRERRFHDWPLLRRRVDWRGVQRRRISRVRLLQGGRNGNDSEDGRRLHWMNASQLHLDPRALRLRRLVAVLRPPHRLVLSKALRKHLGDDHGDEKDECDRKEYVCGLHGGGVGRERGRGREGEGEGRGAQRSARARDGSARDAQERSAGEKERAGCPTGLVATHVEVTR